MGTDTFEHPPGTALSRCPAAEALVQAQAVNTSSGHENLGPLSDLRGFLPLRDPARALPVRYRAWDETAAALPELTRSSKLRKVLDGLPVLSAGPSSLPDHDLPRAATVLGMLGHGYAYEMAGPPALPPDGIMIPWQQVRLRLGRHGPPVLSYTDLIVHNWKRRDDTATDDLTLSNLELLVPGIGSQDEEVFYLTQLEILARCAPVVGAVIAAQDAVLRSDDEAVAAALDTITRALTDVSQRLLPQIDPHRRSRTHVDPVRWAKTVAPFAVPLQAGVLGPSGTASPVFNLLDAVFGRRAHASQLGQEIRQHRSSYPANWRALLAAVDRVSVPAYVERRSDTALTDRLQATLDAYTGADGFLGRHRRKVLGYLEIAFKVGRGVTIGGFTGSPGDRAWQQVDDALVQSSAERRPAAAAAPARALDAPCPLPDAGGHEPGGSCDRLIPVSELSRHNNVAAGFWIAVAGRVHDITAFLDRHPGGADVLRAYAGTDATAAFTRAHRPSAGLEQRRRTVDIGALHRPALPDAPEPQHPDHFRQAYERWVATLLTVIELQNALRLDRSLGQGTLLTDQDGTPPTGYVQQRAADTLRRYQQEYLPALRTRLIQPLAADSAATHGPPQTASATPVVAAQCVRLPVHATSPTEPPVVARSRSRTTEAARLRHRLDAVDRELTGLADPLRAGVLALEQKGDAARLSTERERAAAQLAVVLLADPVCDTEAPPRGGGSA